jgi:hypothetical protein
LKASTTFKPIRVNRIDGTLAPDSAPSSIAPVVVKDAAAPLEDTAINRECSGLISRYETIIRAARAAT